MMEQEDLHDLHELLSELETILARRTEPANWNAPGIDAIHEIQEIIEEMS